MATQASFKESKSHQKASLEPRLPEFYKELRADFGQYRKLEKAKERVVAIRTKLNILF